MKPWPARALTAIATIGLVAVVSAQGQRGATPPTGPGQAQGQGAPPQGRGQPQPARDNQQAPVVGTGSITGTVVLEGAGTPVRRARVNLVGGELRGGRTSVTNDNGQFSFTALPAGRFTMSASKPGYVDIAYGAKRAGRPGTPIQLADGQTLEKANISMPRGSVVSGVVIDENGEPSPSTSVRVMRYVIRTGERTLQQSSNATTDDRGMYRIWGLQPGEYVVSAAPRNLNLGGIRETMMAEIESLMQQAQAMGAGRGAGFGPVGAGGQGGGAGGAGGGGGGRAGRGAEQIAQVLGGGRGQNLIDRANLLQQQLQQQEQEQNVAYAPVYYPGTTSLTSAASVTLGIGEERGGVDFQLQLVATAKIQGSVQSPDGNLPAGTQISLLPADQAGLMIPGGQNQTRPDREGKFTFSSVTPGQYRLMARAVVRDPNAAAAGRAGRGGRGDFGPGGGRGGQIDQVLWASSDVTVGGRDIPDLVLNLQPGMTVSGRMTFEGSSLTPPADLTRVRVSLTARGQQVGMEMGPVPPGEVDATGRFTIVGVAPGKYAISAGAPAGGTGQAAGAAGATVAGAGRGGAATTGGAPPPQWVLKSAVFGGKDVLDFPLVIEPNQDAAGMALTFIDRTQEVSGTIQDPQGKPAADYTIIIFPADNRYWQPQSRRIQSSRPGTDGKFTFRNLPPGDYRIGAVTDVEPGEWYNPDFLSQLVNASIQIQLAEGERKVQDIRMK